jgi:hypothetical protein
MLKLYHFSNKDKIKVLLPCYFANNSYTLQDYNTCKIKRIFFYDKINASEKRITELKHLYIAKIKENKIYNLITDTENLINNTVSITELLNKIKALHYTGIIYTVCNNNIICLFNKIKVKQIY